MAECARSGQPGRRAAHGGTSARTSESRDQNSERNWANRGKPLIVKATRGFQLTFLGKSNLLRVRVSDPFKNPRRKMTCVCHVGWGILFGVKSWTHGHRAIFAATLCCFLFLPQMLLLEERENCRTTEKGERLGEASLRAGAACF